MWLGLVDKEERAGSSNVSQCCVREGSSTVSECDNYLFKQVKQKNKYLIQILFKFIEIRNNKDGILLFCQHIKIRDLNEETYLAFSE